MSFGGCEEVTLGPEILGVSCALGSGRPSRSFLIVSGVTQLEIGSHLGKWRAICRCIKFLHLQGEDGSQLSGEQRSAWLSGPILRESGCSDWVRNADCGIPESISLLCCSLLLPQLSFPRDL